MVVNHQFFFFFGSEIFAKFNPNGTSAPSSFFLLVWYFLPDRAPRCGHHFICSIPPITVSRRQFAPAPRLRTANSIVRITYPRREHYQVRVDTVLALRYDLSNPQRLPLEVLFASPSPAGYSGFAKDGPQSEIPAPDDEGGWPVPRCSPLWAEGREPIRDRYRQRGLDAAQQR
ncbi:hypothetical protein L209DRAFT_313256 [Thermothelomyces heterothallicus CBS 203.75]